MVVKKTEAIEPLAIDYVEKRRDWLVVERLRLFRLTKDR
jgi:hypothetical protein